MKWLFITAFGLEQALNTSTIHDYSIDNFHNITIEVKNNTLGIVILCTCIVIAFLSVFLYCYFRKGPSESFDVSCSFESDRANGATVSKINTDFILKTTFKHYLIVLTVSLKKSRDCGQKKINRVINYVCSVHDIKAFDF